MFEVIGKGVVALVAGFAFGLFVLGPLIVGWIEVFVK